MLFEVEINYNKLGNQLLVTVSVFSSLFGMPSASMVSKILEKWSTIMHEACNKNHSPAICIYLIRGRRRE